MIRTWCKFDNVLKKWRVVCCRKAYVNCFLNDLELSDLIGIKTQDYKKKGSFINPRKELEKYFAEKRKRKGNFNGIYIL